MPEEAIDQLEITPPSKTLLDALKELMTNPAFQEQMAKQVVNKRPPGTSSRSNYAYYREQFGLEMKVVFDEMMVSKKDKIYLYANFKISRTSLYLRVNQSIKYLLNELDFDGTYKKFKDQITVERVKTGVAIQFLKDKLQGIQFIPSDYEGEDKPRSIMQEIESFLQDDECKVFKKDVMLSPEDIKQIELSLSPLETVNAVVLNHQIKIVKI